MTIYVATLSDAKQVAYGRRFNSPEEAVLELAKYACGLDSSTKLRANVHRRDHPWVNSGDILPHVMDVLRKDAREMSADERARVWLSVFPEHKRAPKLEVVNHSIKPAYAKGKI